MRIFLHAANEQALGERIKPVMAINKLEQGFLELQLDWEMFYTNFSRQVDLVNRIIDTHRNDIMGDMQVNPAKGSVAFTAGKKTQIDTLS